MKTVIEGKNIETGYLINKNTKIIKDEDGNDKEIFTDKPELIRNSVVASWETICKFEGEPHYNNNIKDIFHPILPSTFKIGSLNISENETVNVIEQIFRADTNELHLRTDKVCHDKYIGKLSDKEKFNEYIAQFNEEMINSNDKMKNYCDVHKLDPKETDCIKLFNILYPNEEYNIVDGKMICKDENKDDECTWETYFDIARERIEMARRVY
jgi:hypothetical protein